MSMLGGCELRSLRRDMTLGSKQFAVSDIVFRSPHYETRDEIVVF